MMNKITVFIGAFVLLITLFSCEAYEDYTYDYDYTTVYFGSQKPVRTIVADDDMSFEFGVTMGGVRSNNNEEWVSFSIDESLLATYDVDGNYTLLPDSYYTLSDDELFVIAEGEYKGVVTCTLDRDAFTSDPLSKEETYVIPLRINDSSLDSILSSKDYSIIVVKYISPYHGTYYSKGVQYELDEYSFYVDSIVFSDADLSQNLTKEFSTVGLNTISTNVISADTDGELELTVVDDFSVEMSTSAVSISENYSYYDGEEKRIYMDYKFEKEGVKYHTLDTLILRQDPELDLRYDDWQE